MMNALAELEAHSDKTDVSILSLITSILIMGPILLLVKSFKRMKNDLEDNQNNSIKLHDIDLKAKMIKEPALIFKDRFIFYFAIKLFIVVPHLFIFRVMIAIHIDHLDNHEDPQDRVH